MFKIFYQHVIVFTATLQTQGNVKCCSFTLDGAILSTASADNLVYVWEVSSLRLLKKLKKHDQRWANSFLRITKSMYIAKVDITYSG